MTQTYRCECCGRVRYVQQCRVDTDVWACEPCSRLPWERYVLLVELRGWRSLLGRALDELLEYLGDGEATAEREDLRG